MLSVIVDSSMGVNHNTVLLCCESRREGEVRTSCAAVLLFAACRKLRATRHS